MHGLVPEVELLWYGVQLLVRIRFRLAGCLWARIGLPPKTRESVESLSRMGCRSLMMRWRGFSWGLYVMASGVLLVSFLGLSCSRRLLGTRLALLICFLISSCGYCSFENAWWRSCRCWSLSEGLEQMRLYLSAWL